MGAFGGQQVAKMPSTINAKNDIEKSRLRGGPGAGNFCEPVPRRGVRGEVNLPPGGSEVRKVGK